MFCKYCGKENISGAKFCKYCGKETLVLGVQKIGEKKNTDIKCLQCGYIGKPKKGRHSWAIVLAWLCILFAPIVTILYFAFSHKWVCPNCGSKSIGEIDSQGNVVIKRSNIFLIIFLILVGIAIMGILATIVVVNVNSAREKATVLNNSQQSNNLSQSKIRSVVNVLCDNNQGGSGTIMLDTGTIVTNNHVVVGAGSCVVTIPDPTTGSPVEIYTAKPFIDPKLNKTYDVAILTIDSVYTDVNGKTWGSYPNTFPVYNNPSNCGSYTPQLRDAIWVYGYPVTSGGYNLTVVPGVISSFTSDGLILTDAKIDSGNSGGLAVTQKDGCIVGIPSAISEGNYQNLGVIIPSSVVLNFFNQSQTSDWTPANTCLTGCYYKGKCLQNPPGSYCVTGDPNNAWKCNSGLIEAGNLCVNCSDTACDTSYPGSIYSYYDKNSDKCICDCPTGYVWNSDNTACIIQQSCPLFSSYNYSTGKCECDSGYFAVGNSCESDYTYCTNKEGYGASYDSLTNSCTCSSGYVYNSNSGQCETCSHRWGIGAEYNYSTGGCECMYGYKVNSAGTGCVYSGY